MGKRFDLQDKNTLGDSKTREPREVVYKYSNIKYEIDL
jgi:hypothetical protein